ncbi:acyl-CoA thioesterase [Streptomyces incanus]|uniref:Acyl-CoA thioesterase n=1 Tax=Streptomyces incanus TaxID=887453 RepID=A0ABW0XFW3_9ACTN
MSARALPDLEHTCEVALRPNDFDWAGHLNNSVYVQLLETGRWEWGIACGGDPREGELVAVVLQLRLDYLTAVDWDPVGRLVVRTALAGRTAYSFSLTQGIERTDGTVVARGRVRLGLLHRDTKRVHRADLHTLLNIPGQTA